jgi:hypothetical protein
MHIPRTGGMWLEEVTERLGIIRQKFKGDIDAHLAWNSMPPFWRQLHPFSFIRHPWSWVRSRWSHSVEHGIAADYRHYGINRVFDTYVMPSFADTLRKILAENPGVVSWTFNKITEGIPRENLRCTEDLPEAAWELLHRFEGISREQLQVIERVLPINGTSKMDKYRLELDSVPTSIIQDFITSEDSLVQLWQDSRMIKD